MALALWLGFFLLVLLGLFLDLGVLHRTPRSLKPREALGWTAFWIVQALGFSAVVYWIYDSQYQGFGIQLDASVAGKEAVWLYLASYLTEKSLSLDNVVVMALIFSDFRIPLALQHRVLLWGVLGAIVLRILMIVCGVALIRELAWITYAFGALLIVSALRLLRAEEDRFEPEKSLMARVAGKVFPLTSDLERDRFLVRRDGRIHLTRLALVLVLVEGSDVMFAVDSIPAVLAITPDPFLVATSNIFAILGLRSLYFAIAPLMERFHHLKSSLVVLLGFVGVKLLLAHHVAIPPALTLVVIAAILSMGVALSVVTDRRALRRGQDVPRGSGAMKR